ncbi:MAG TPA: hypothetical protein VII06_30220 [Chloroflexota bacterium]|jgi:hypothetical protein
MTMLRLHKAERDSNGAVRPIAQCPVVAVSSRHVAWCESLDGTTALYFGGESPQYSETLGRHVPQPSLLVVEGLDLIVGLIDEAE